MTAPQCLQVRKRQAAEKALEHGRKLGLDIGERKEFLVQQVLAALAVPLQAIELTVAPPPLDHQADRIGESLRRMRYARRQQQDLSRADRQIRDGPVLHHAQHHLALELLKEFLGGIDVEILAAVRASDRHDDEFAVLVDDFVAHGWSQQVTVAVDPLSQVDGMKRACRRYPTLSEGVYSRMVSILPQGGDFRALGICRIAELPSHRTDAGRNGPWRCAWRWLPAACTGRGVTKRRRRPRCRNSSSPRRDGAASASILQFWDRNTLQLDLTGASGEGAAVMRPLPRPRAGRSGSSLRYSPAASTHLEVHGAAARRVRSARAGRAGRVQAGARRLRARYGADYCSMERG